MFYSLKNRELLVSLLTLEAKCSLNFVDKICTFIDPLKYSKCRPSTLTRCLIRSEILVYNIS